MKGLTPKQQAILQFINRVLDEKGYAPTYREIKEYFQLSSLGSVTQYIEVLEKKGVLRKKKQIHRSLEPSFNEHERKQKILHNIPWIGNLSVGYPIELFKQPQHMSIPEYLLQEPDNTYVLQVQGDSLQVEGFFGGDFLLVESRQDVAFGETILGLINHTESILKKYYLEEDQIRLVSQNPLISAITVDRQHLAIQGVLVSMFRILNQPFSLNTQF